jgi:Cu2+-exporting ATPase
MFRDKFWLSFALTIPVVFWSTDVQHWLGYTAPSFPGSKFIPAILGTIVFVYGGLVFIRGAWGEIADRKPGMMTLISLAIIVAFRTSLAATFGLFEIDVWWELASLITIMILGHWLEMRAVSSRAGRSTHLPPAPGYRRARTGCRYGKGPRLSVADVSMNAATSNLAAL